MYTSVHQTLPLECFKASQIQQVTNGTLESPCPSPCLLCPLNSHSSGNGSFTCISSPDVWENLAPYQQVESGYSPRKTCDVWTGQLCIGEWKLCIFSRGYKVMSLIEHNPSGHKIPDGLLAKEGLKAAGDRLTAWVCFTRIQLGHGLIHCQNPKAICLFNNYQIPT